MIHTRVQLAIFTRSGRRSRNPIKLRWRFAGGWVSVVIDITLLVEEHDQQPRPKNGATSVSSPKHDQIEIYKLNVIYYIHV